jgi:hypothetical protein
MLQVRAEVDALLTKDPATCPLLATLAYQCASTFRATDWHGALPSLVASG